MNRITLVIIDDHTLIRETWSQILNSDPRFLVVAEAGNAEEGLELCKKHRPDLVLLDINLPGMSGIAVVPLIRKYAPGSRIIAISLHTQIAFAKKMIKSGASGYVTKSSSRMEMLQALIEINEGNKYICSEIKNALAEGLVNEEKTEANLNRLSLREMEIIDLIKLGLSSKEIASSKSISAKTVEVHRYNILKKLNLKNAASLVNYINHSNITSPNS